MTTKERIDRAEQRLDKHDREIAAIKTLLKQGMRLLVEVQQSQKEIQQTVKELAEAQKNTDASLQAFIDSLKRGGNGHSKTDLNP